MRTLNERQPLNWRKLWKSQGDTLREKGYFEYNRCHPQGPATRWAFAFPEPAMTQMILGWLFMIAILGGMAWVAYRSESRGEKGRKP